MPSFYFIIYNHRIIKKAYFSISELKNILRGDIMSCCSYTIGTIVDISDIMNQPYKFITIDKVPGDIYTYDNEYTTSNVGIYYRSKIKL